MSKLELTLSDHKDCYLTLSHNTEDPSTWIIRRWKSGLFGKRMTLARWFLTQGQAEAYAAKLVKESGANRRSS
ncbi:MAG: hypothetical protein WBQ23_11515 [Bacteroidota bacterium]